MKQKPGRKRPFDQDFDYHRYRAWVNNRNLARLRNEAFELSVEDFFTLWRWELWQQRGRSSAAMVMTRCDPTGPWSLANTKICRRDQQLREKMAYKITKDQECLTQTLTL